MELSSAALPVFFLFVVAFGSDLVRTIFEISVNFLWRSKKLPPIELGPQSAAIVIACHNSEDSIEGTVETLPAGYRIYCVANNCTDNTAGKVRELRSRRPEVQLIDVDYPEKSKSKAAILGALQASSDGFTHFLLLDDDVVWPENRPIEVLDPSVAVTAVPILPERPSTVLEHFQIFEYIASNTSKRCQMYFAGDVTWASGAAAIYRTDVYLEVMRLHDGEFAGEDVQCSYLHHYMGYKIDFLPQTIVGTYVPQTLPQWWRQRSHSWDVSFMFLHIELLLRVLFRFGEKQPGWWIRLLTFYRIYDTFLVLIKLGMPLVVLQVPEVALLFVATTYLLIGMHLASYPFFFTPLRVQMGGTDVPRTALAFLAFPAYNFLTWISRLMALPRAVYLKLHPRALLGEFIDQNFGACTRVDLECTARSLKSPEFAEASHRINRAGPVRRGYAV